MAFTLYSAQDFCARLIATFPKRWARSAAFKGPTKLLTESGDALTTEAGEDLLLDPQQSAGTFYAIFFSLANYGLAFLMQGIAYLRLQTRLATLTDAQVDLAWKDFFGTRKGRYPGESDAASTLRLRLALSSPTGTHDAILAAVDEFFSVNPSNDLARIDVFDAQSDPIRAAYYGVGNAQFAVILYYPVEPGEGWHLGQSALGQSAILTDPYAFTRSLTADPRLMQAVNDIKDFTYRPIYITAKTDPPFGNTVISA